MSDHVASQTSPRSFAKSSQTPRSFALGEFARCSPTRFPSGDSMVASSGAQSPPVRQLVLGGRFDCSPFGLCMAQVILEQHCEAEYWFGNGDRSFLWTLKRSSLLAAVLTKRKCVGQPSTLCPWCSLFLNTFDDFRYSLGYRKASISVSFLHVCFGHNK